MPEADALAAIALLAGAYWCGSVRRPHVAGWSSAGRDVQAACFAAGITTLVIALASPLDTRADHSLTTHMIQHVLLLTVAPPLLAAGAPGRVLPWLLPTDVRRGLLRSRTHLRRLSLARHGTAWIVFGVVAQTAAIAAWHLPSSFDAAVASPPLHAFEHLSFLGTGFLLWWALLEAGRGRLRGGGVIAVFFACLPASALGVLMTLATTPWYPHYAASPGALADQQLAGVVMWGFGSGLTAIAAVAMFAAWLRSLEGAHPSRRAATGVGAP